MQLSEIDREKEKVEIIKRRREVRKSLEAFERSSDIPEDVNVVHKPPPNTIELVDEKPQDSIPDLPENKAVRDFLASAPSKGLWMPLGKEVKCMQCWKCKQYGHRSGDKECPLFVSGNRSLEEQRQRHEDPMIEYLKEEKEERKKRKREKSDRLKQLQLLLEETEKQHRERKRRKKLKRKDKNSSDSSQRHHSRDHSPGKKHKHKHKHK